MAKRKKVDIDPGPACSPTVEQHEAAIAQLRMAYEDHLEDLIKGSPEYEQIKPSAGTEISCIAARLFDRNSCCIHT